MRRSKSTRSQASMEASAYWVDNEGPMASSICHVVGNKMGVPPKKYTPMEIMQDEEPTKVEPRVPEGVWNPGIQVIVRIRRHVVSNYGGAFIVIIIVDDLGAWIRSVIILRPIPDFRRWTPVGLR